MFWYSLPLRKLVRRFGIMKERLQKGAFQIVAKESSLRGGTTKQSADETIKRLIIARADRFVPHNDGET